MRFGKIWAMAAVTTLGISASAVAQDADPFLWLEEFTSPRVMEWVEAHNAKTLARLEGDPRFATFNAQALEIAQASDRIPSGRFLGGEIYNFWQDANHVRGILRKTSLADYATSAPRWTTVLDLDALARREGANWVYKGMDCARPAETRCLISLSDGGEDAVTIREFDLLKRRFVAGGFVLPKGKQRVTWESENSLLVSREWRPGELGRTGYPFIVKRVIRGRPLSAARELYRGRLDDGGYGVTPTVLRDAQGRTIALIKRPLDTFRSETHVVTPAGVKLLGVPAKSDAIALIDGRLVIQLDEAWRPAGSARRFPAGSLVAVPLANALGAPARLKPSLIYAPGPREALNGATASKGVLIVSILDNVRGRALLFRPAAGGRWTRSALELPENSSVSLVDASDRDDQALIGVTGFLTPPSLWLADAASAKARRIITQPAKFDAANLTVDQRFAVSSDGTRIPYFIVHRRDIKLDGSNPTLVQAYGGFAVSQTPTYSATIGKLWLERGGVFVLANIRGGGEFGPAWHEAGLGAKRQIIYDDFAAVGRDLISSRVTSARRMGIRGGSNGGLLTGVQFTQHPELWNAAIIDIPLLDMLRISKIAAGASWEGEYGSIDDPAVRAFWTRVSPYHNLRAGTRYPEPFILTTTKDDRVGPQHARKFAARLDQLGLPYYYYENTEGGHAAGANLRQSARAIALQMVYLSKTLMD